MRLPTPVLAAALWLALVPVAGAQQYASVKPQSFKVCSGQATEQGIEAVRDQCGNLAAPVFASKRFSSLTELEGARQQREVFSHQVTQYGRCVNAFIQSYRRPGAPADSTAPDQAACAHAWAEDQATQAVRDFGKACIDYSNRSMTERGLSPWSGECYPSFGRTPG